MISQVKKACANHYITPHTKLSKFTNSTNSWMWTALDFADPDHEVEGQQEKFVVRFKLETAAESFKSTFDLAVLQARRSEKGLLRFFWFSFCECPL